MSDRSSRIHVIASQGAEMDAVIAQECQEIVRQAAGQVLPGSTIKAQIRQACRNLGYRDGNWRVRASWYGEAGSFSAGAVRDLQTRFTAWRERESLRASSAADLERIRQAAADRVALERVRAQHLAELAKIEVRLAALGEDRPV